MIFCGSSEGKTGLDSVGQRAGVLVHWFSIWIWQYIGFAGVDL